MILDKNTTYVNGRGDLLKIIELDVGDNYPVLAKICNVDAPIGPFVNLTSEGKYYLDGGSPLDIVGIYTDKIIPTDDKVNHPSHYNKKDIEVIDVIEAFELGFNLGNAIKYIARSDSKGAAIEDLKKARWYLDREINNKEKV